MRISSSEYYQQAVSAIDRQQSTLSRLQSEMSSGLRVQTAADDPVAMGQVLGIQQAQADNARWQSNATALGTSLSMEGSALSSVSSALGQIQTLSIQANSGTLSASDRQAIAAQMQQLLTSIVGSANAQDANGNYLFGGTQSSSPPFTSSAAGISYNGNSGTAPIPVGPTSELAGSDAGDAVFMNLASGDGQVNVAAGVANAGSASVSAAAVSDPAQYVPGTYTITLSGGQYTVTDGSNRTVASGVYASGNAIQFAGTSLTLTGTPASGDSFTVSPSGAQDLFTTVQKMIQAVASPHTAAAANAINQTSLYNLQKTLSGAQSHIALMSAGVGARQQAASSALTSLQAQSTQLSGRLSDLQDLDYAKATTQLSQTQVSLQAAEQTYVAIQGLSLFNYIR